MKATLLVLATAMVALISAVTHAQVVVDNTLTPQELVEQVLLGEGVEVSNITFSGNAQQAGFFSAVNGNFLLEEGVVMSTGSVLDVPGDADDFSSSGFGQASDPDLNAISNGATRDAAILEFDFIPTGDSIIFNYVIASEEYPNFCCGDFNDVFAFLISGPGFNGPFTNDAENIALLPSSTTPVSISNVNNGPANNGPCTNCAYYVNNASGGADGIAFNAHTTVLTALAQVQCGETYRIKLAIADVFDNIYDSGVFLEARSFSSNAIQVDITTLSGDSSIVEGCTGADITFSRPESDTALAIPVYLSGSAVNGVNYTGVPDTVIFAPNETDVTFQINALDDGVFQPEQDTIIITVYTLNLCGDSVETEGIIFIREDYMLDVTVQSELIACADIYGYSQISSEVSGGNPPYYYEWSNGETTPGINVAPEEESTFTVTVTDSCGVGTQTVSITVPASVSAPAPSVNVSNDLTLVCPDDEATLTAIGSGGTPPYSYAWTTGLTGSTVNVQPTVSSDYIVTLTDACFPGPIRDTIRVTVEPYTPLTVQAENYVVDCPGNDLPVDLIIENGLEPVDITWSNGLSGTSNILNPTEDETITITATDFCNTEVTEDINLSVAQYAPLQGTINDTVLSALDTISICELWADTLWVNATGGLSPYAYSWEGSLAVLLGTDNDSIEIRAPFELPSDSSVTEIYSVTITDQCGVDTMVDVTVNIINCDIVQPDIFNPSSNWLGDADFCGSTPQNNVFNLPCLELYPGNRVVVFDRWGRKTYEAENYHLNPWDGGNSSDGVFYYIVEVPDRADIIQGYFHMVSGAQ